MNDITMTAPAAFAAGDTTYIGERAYTVTPARTIEQVHESDVAALEASGYTRPQVVTETPVVLPDPQPAPEPEPAEEPPAVPAEPHEG